MGPSLVWLRVAIVLSWAAGAAGVGVDWWCHDSLPEPLRGYAPDLGSLQSELGHAVALLVVLALLVAGSVGVLLLWPPARLLYTTGSLASLALLLGFGPRVAHGWAEPFYEIGSMASGAALALLYLSPAAQAFGSVPPDAAAAQARPRGSAALRSAALLVVGALAGIGALFVAAGFAFMTAVGVMEGVESEAKRVAAGSDAAGCFATARERLRENDDVLDFEWPFLGSCLEHVRDLEVFCRDVPPLGVEDDARNEPWLDAHCGDGSNRTECEGLLYTVQQYCADL
jgi:hypothetical protein